MNMKKITAAVMSGAVAVSAMAVTASAEGVSINATLGFTDTNWTYQDWESSVEITGDGQYTIESTAVAGTEEIGVFVIDCNGMFADYPDATATLDSITIDGEEVSFDASKIMYGDIEEKGNYRIDIYNMYSDTKDDPAFTNATPITTSLAVTFTVSGLGDAAASDTTEEAAEEDTSAEETTDEATDAATDEAPASDDVTDSATTGNASAAAIAAVMAVAGAAVVLSKRK